MAHKMLSMYSISSVELRHVVVQRKVQGCTHSAKKRVGAYEPSDTIYTSLCTSYIAVLDDIRGVRERKE